MAKTVGGMDDNGHIYRHKVTRHQKRSEASLIPWAKGPTTRRARFARSWWG